MMNCLFGMRGLGKRKISAFLYLWSSCHCYQLQPQRSLQNRKCVENKLVPTSLLCSVRWDFTAKLQKCPCCKVCQVLYLFIPSSGSPLRIIVPFAVSLLNQQLFPLLCKACLTKTKSTFVSHSQAPQLSHSFNIIICCNLHRLPKSSHHDSFYIFLHLRPECAKSQYI